MLDSSTVYLMLAMGTFVFIAIIMIHKHNSTNQIRRKTGEVEAFSAQINQKITIIENEVIDLKLKIDELDDEIEAHNV